MITAVAALGRGFVQGCSSGGQSGRIATDCNDAGQDLHQPRHLADLD
jgi:hypothetical protein